MKTRRRRWVRARRYGNRHVVVDHRGRVYGRYDNARAAKAKLAKVLAAKRRRHPPVGRTGDGRRLEIRQRGKHYTVVDSTGRIYAREKDYGYAYRAWRRAMVGLGKQMGRKRGLWQEAAR